ncbi:MAG TPA: hypothetical protein VFS77_13500 [Pyrinomonadaceae bacterium]|nr:hypothetical protein [Pyrinomonadaceae bacterium]
MKVLAQKKRILSFPRFTLVNPRITVPSNEAFMRVSNATVREGGSGRVWPPDVLRKFQMAEVVTENTINHYVLRELSISPVRSV